MSDTAGQLLAADHPNHQAFQNAYSATDFSANSTIDPQLHRPSSSSQFLSFAATSHFSPHITSFNGDLPPSSSFHLPSNSSCSTDANRSASFRAVNSSSPSSTTMRCMSSSSSVDSTTDLMPSSSGYPFIQKETSEYGHGDSGAPASNASYMNFQPAAAAEARYFDKIEEMKAAVLRRNGLRLQAGASFLQPIDNTTPQAKNIWARHDQHESQSDEPAKKFFSSNGFSTQGQEAAAAASSTTSTHEANITTPQANYLSTLRAAASVRGFMWQTGPAMGGMTLSTPTSQAATSCSGLDGQAKQGAAATLPIAAGEHFSTTNAHVSQADGSNQAASCVNGEHTSRQELQAAVLRSFLQAPSAVPGMSFDQDTQAAAAVPSEGSITQTSKGGPEAVQGTSLRANHNTAPAINGSLCTSQPNQVAVNGWTDSNGASHEESGRVIQSVYKFSQAFNNIKITGSPDQMNDECKTDAAPFQEGTAGGSPAAQLDLQGDSYLGDLQASVCIAQGVDSLQKFLPSNSEEEDMFEEEMQLGGALFGCDEFRMYEFKVRLCMRERSHDWTQCPFAHPGEKARRRDPRMYHYSAVPCPDFRKSACKRGDACELSHGVFECWLHPSRYRTQICKDGKQCKRKVCFFAHSPSQFRTVSSNNNPSAAKLRTNSSQQLPPTHLPLPPAIHLTSSNLDGPSINLPYHFIQQLPRSYYEALVKHHDSHLLANYTNMGISPALNAALLLNHHLHPARADHAANGTVMASTGALPLISCDGSPLRLYGSPTYINGMELEGLNFARHNKLDTQSLTSLPYDASIFQSSASPSGFLCYKDTPRDLQHSNLNELHSAMHSSGQPLISLQEAAAVNGIPKQYILNDGLHDGFSPINKVALSVSGLRNMKEHQIGLPITSLSMHRHSHAPGPHSLPVSDSYNSANIHMSWDTPRFSPGLNARFSPQNTLTQTQAVLAAHALAHSQTTPDPRELTSPLSPMSHDAVHHLDTLSKGTQGVANYLAQDIMAEHNRQNTAASLDSPQAMSHLIASIQQLELRCATAEMKNKMLEHAAVQQAAGKVVMSPHMSNPLRANQSAADQHLWEGSLKAERIPPFQIAEFNGNMKAPVAMYGMVRQDATMPTMPEKDPLGWVDELT